jgi:uncharacterized DUF497 family protein
VEFEWDPDKAAENLRKHWVSFKDASTVFGDHFGVAARDPDHSIGEQRYILVGASIQMRLLLVCYTERAKRIRIMSARELTTREKKVYEETDE